MLTWKEHVRINLVLELVDILVFLDVRLIKAVVKSVWFWLFILPRRHSFVFMQRQKVRNILNIQPFVLLRKVLIVVLLLQKRLKLFLVFGCLLYDFHDVVAFVCVDEAELVEIKRLGIVIIQEVKH